MLQEKTPKYQLKARLFAIKSDKTRLIYHLIMVMCYFFSQVFEKPQINCDMY